MNKLAGDFGLLHPLRATKKIYPSGKSYKAWECLCDCCGEEVVVLDQSLRSGASRRCSKSRAASNLEGERFGSAKALKRVREAASNHAMWECLCDCGEVFIARADLVKKGGASCGCKAGQHSRTHGMTKSPEYRAWRSMLNRCKNPRTKDYQSYGGRGIKVCAAWESFESFYFDMGARPNGTTIDRIDVNGDYEPSNCRWADIFVQNNNTRRSKIIEWGGQSMSVRQWERKLGTTRDFLGRNLRNGLTVEQAFKAAQQRFS